MIEWIKESVSPSKPLSIQGIEGYETFKIDENTIGVRAKWIKCSESMPAIGKYILLYLKSRQRIDLSPYLVVFFDESDKFKKWSDWENSYLFTTNSDLWMPLPEPPNEL